MDLLIMLNMYACQCTPLFSSDFNLSFSYLIVSSWKIFAQWLYSQYWFINYGNDFVINLINKKIGEKKSKHKYG